jgi:hypothetical protein
MVFRSVRTPNMARTLTPPRAGAPVTRRSMLQRWRTHAAQEAPQWFPLCESNVLPWIPQINRWFPVPKYREWVDMSRPTGDHITRCLISCLLKFEVEPFIPHVHTGCPWEPPKTIGNPCVSACPLKGRILRLSPKSYAYCRTLIKIGKSEECNRKILCRPNPGAKRAVAPQPDPTRPPFKKHWRSLRF